MHSIYGMTCWVLFCGVVSMAMCGMVWHGGYSIYVSYGMYGWYDMYGLYVMFSMYGMHGRYGRFCRYGIYGTSMYGL